MSGPQRQAGERDGERVMAAIESSIEAESVSKTDASTTRASLQFIVPLTLELHSKLCRRTVERRGVLDFERPHRDHFRIVSHPAEQRW